VLSQTPTKNTLVAGSVIASIHSETVKTHASRMQARLRMSISNSSIRLGNYAVSDHQWQHPQLCATAMRHSCVIQLWGTAVHCQNLSMYQAAIERAAYCRIKHIHCRACTITMPAPHLWHMLWAHTPALQASGLGHTQQRSLYQAL